MNNRSMIFRIFDVQKRFPGVQINALADFPARESAGMMLLVKEPIWGIKINRSVVKGLSAVDLENVIFSLQPGEQG